MHELDRAHVQPASRLRRDQDLRIPIDLPGEDDLLLVSAGERAGLGLRTSPSNVELPDEPLRALDETSWEQPAEPRSR